MTKPQGRPLDLRRGIGGTRRSRGRSRRSPRTSRGRTSPTTSTRRTSCSTPPLERLRPMAIRLRPPRAASTGRPCLPIPRAAGRRARLIRPASPAPHAASAPVGELANRQCDRTGVVATPGVRPCHSRARHLIAAAVRHRPRPPDEAPPAASRREARTRAHRTDRSDQARLLWASVGSDRSGQSDQRRCPHRTGDAGTPTPVDGFHFGLRGPAGRIDRCVRASAREPLAPDGRP